MKHMLLAALALSLFACDSSGTKPAGTDQGKKASTSAKKAPGDTKTAADKKGPAAESAPKSEDKKLEQLGLTATLPAMSQVSDAIGGKGVMVVGLAPVNITEAKADAPKTIEAAKKDAADFKPENFKEEKLDDGWVLTYENKGSMGTNYWLKVRREIDGKAYMCDTSVSKEEQRKAALAICKSLKKS